ncbi:MAG: hypothetical protein KatS3mg058_4104 [Roseiflexus sp.]|nr:MAG: hypothetical protein KatS3mg058_4104 [Roseiflexus sp.]
MCGVLGRRGAVHWRLLRPFRRRFSFSGLPLNPRFGQPAASFPQLWTGTPLVRCALSQPPVL